MHDSGERQSFGTGAVRDTAGDKPRLELISPFALRRLGDWLAEGAKKYADRNWEKGIPYTRCVASLLRHAEAYLAGEDDEDHMAAVMCNAMFLLHYEEMVGRGVLPSTLDDRPRYSRAPAIIAMAAGTCTVQEDDVWFPDGSDLPTRAGPRAHKWPKADCGCESRENNGSDHGN